MFWPLRREVQLNAQQEALVEAIQNSNLENVRELLEAGVNPNFDYEKSFNIPNLFAGCEEYAPRVYDEIVTPLKDVISNILTSWSPMLDGEEACKNNDLLILEALIRYDADMNSRGEGALAYAITHTKNGREPEFIRVATELLKGDADILQLNERGQNLLAVSLEYIHHLHTPIGHNPEVDAFLRAQCAIAEARRVATAMAATYAGAMLRFSEVGGSDTSILEDAIEFLSAGPRSSDIADCMRAGFEVAHNKYFLQS